MRQSLLLEGADGVERRLALDGRDKVWLGSDPSCDLIVAAGGRVACLRRWNDEWLLVASDEGAIAIGGVPLAPKAARVVRPGDRVSIEAEHLALVEDEGGLWDAPPPSEGGEMGTAALALRAVNDALRGPRAPETTSLRVVEGADLGRTFPLPDEDRAYVVGRGDGCDVVLDDEAVSRRHVRLVRKGERMFVCDLGSAGGTQLGAQALTPRRDVAWTDRSMLRLGDTVLALDWALEVVVARRSDELVARYGAPEPDVQGAPRAEEAEATNVDLPPPDDAPRPSAPSEPSARPEAVPPPRPSSPRAPVAGPARERLVRIGIYAGLGIVILASLALFVWVAFGAEP